MSAITAPLSEEEGAQKIFDDCFAPTDWELS